MVVSPLRAVLAAHLQTTRNRLLRELGRSGIFAVVAVLVLMAVTIVLPMLGLLGLGGWLLGMRLPDDVAATLLGAIASGVSIFGGAGSGVFGGAKQLQWESYRSYPLRLTTLLVAELVASALDMVPLVAGGGLLALFVGVSIARPSLAPLLFLMLIEGVAILLLVQLLVGSLAERAVRRVRTAMLATGLALWVGLALTASIPDELKQEGISGEKINALVKLGVALRGVAQALPATWTARGLEHAQAGRWGLALATHLYPIAVLAALAVVVRAMLAREADHVLDDAAAGGRTWSFRTPAVGVARLQLLTIAQSRIGQFGFFVPLIVVVLIKGPLAHASGRELWAVPGAFAYLSLVGNQFQLNQFGLDGHGVKALRLLPIGERALWRGKMLGLAAYQGVQTTILLGLLAILHRPEPVQMVAGVLLWGCLFLVQNAVGRRTSVWMPRMLPRKSVRGNAMPVALVLVGMALSLGSGAVFGGAWAACVRWAPTLLVPALLVLLGACALAHRLLEPGADRGLRAHQERLLSAIG